MSKLHIALVGGEPTPVYQGIVYANPDRVILICSEKTKKVAENICGQLSALQDVIEIRIFSDTDLHSMEASTAQLASEITADTELSVNLSSGLKVWTLVFYNILHPQLPDAKIFCLGQDGTVFDITADRSDERVDFDMEAQFRLLGNEIASYTSYADYTAEDRSMLNVVKSWSISPRYHDALKELTRAFVDKAKGCDTKPIVVENDESRLEWNPETRSFSGNLKGRNIDFNCPHAWHILLNTGWFEVYVASLLAQFYPPKDIRLNCVFKTRTDAIKNEVDIIVNAGKKLIFVECKTQVFKSIDVDKFASVVRTYGGLGSKALFVTNTPMKAEAQEKCNDKGITTYYTLHEELPTKKEQNVLLKQMLDTLVNSWNAK